MKYYLIIIALTISLLLISVSCSGHNHIQDSNQNTRNFWSRNTDSEQRRIADAIMKSLNDGEAEGLKSLFCQYSLDLPDIDEQIQEAIDYFKDRVISYEELKRAATNGKTYEEGRITRLRTSARIVNISIGEEQIYSIVFHNYIVNENDKDKEGISEIAIIYGNSGNDIKSTIGEFIE